MDKVARHLRKPAGGSSKSDAPQVEWKDQQKLNAYGVLVQQAEALNDDLKQAKLELQTITDGLEEIETLIDDEDGLYVKIGEVFVAMPEEAATEVVERKQSEQEARKEQLEAQIEECEEQKAELKKILYAKFGDSINLEEKD